MVQRIFYALALSIFVSGSGQALAAIIDFEDIYADLCDVSNPATYYQSSLGVTFGGTYWGVIGGVSNGDPGNWDMEGTNGPASLADGDDGGLLTTFAFDSPVNNVSFDVGTSFGDTNDYTIVATLGGSQVGQDVFSLTDDDNGEGTWRTVIFNQTLDAISIAAVSSVVYSGSGLDNIQFSIVPEPAALALASLGLTFIATRRRH